MTDLKVETTQAGATEPKLTRSKIFPWLAGVIVGVISLLASIVDLVTNLDAFGSLPGIPKEVWWIGGSILLVASILLLRNRRNSRSRLPRPEALHLETDKPEHLRGREKDLVELLRYCGEFPQVHLIGKSGAGKSALVRAGLYPTLMAHPRFFPIYIGEWGQHWEEGPGTALIDVIWDALSEDMLAELEIRVRPEPYELATILERFKRKLGQTPLIIFDQFDDYLACHRSRFFPKGSTLLSADELVKKNDFWRQIKQLIDNNAIHCLFVTWNDTSYVLESVRFAKPKVYVLARLNEAVVEPLLDYLTTPGNGEEQVVFAPNGGWNRLKARIAADLSEDGAVLPVQMKVAFHSLRHLDFLTVREYKKKGGLNGLEALSIQSHVREAARSSSLSDTQVRALLHALVNPETQKTVPKSTDELMALITVDTGSNVDSLTEPVEKALDYLKQEEIIRKRLDADTGQNVWILDHDYLCRGVLEAERWANRWYVLAQEGEKAFRDAGREWWQRWKALLQPWEQIVLGFQRLLGRLRYGRLRTYALWSLLRFVPYLLLSAVVWGGWNNYSSQQKARTILASIENHETLSETDYEHIWTLAESSHAVRFQFIKIALDSPGDASRLVGFGGIALHAVVGSDLGMRKKVLRKVILPCLRRPSEYESVTQACLTIGNLLSPEDPTASPFAARTLLAIIENTKEPHVLLFLIRGLQAVPEEFDSTVAMQIVDRLITALDDTNDLEARLSLAQGLEAVAEKIGPKDATRVIDTLITVITKINDAKARRSLELALAAVAKNVREEDAVQVADTLITAIKSTNAPHTLDALKPGLEIVAKKVTREDDAVQVLNKLITMINATSEPEVHRSLTQALMALAKKVDVEYAVQAVDTLIAAIKKNPLALEAFGQGLELVAEKVDREDATPMADKLVVAINNASDSLAFVILGRGLEAVASQLDSGDTAQVADKLVTVIENTIDSNKLEALTQGLVAVTKKIDQKHAMQAVDKLILLINKTSDPRILRLLSEGLQAMPGELALKDATQIINKLVTVINDTNNLPEFQDLGQGLEAVAKKIGQEDTAQLATTLVTVIKSTDDPFALEALAQGLATVPGALDSSAAMRVGDKFIIGVKSPQNYGEFLSLRNGSETIVEKIGPEITGQVIKKLLAIIDTRRGPDALQSLALVLQSGPGDVDIQTLIDLLKWPICIDDCSTALLEKLEAQTNSKFGGSLWRMAEWAEQEGFDVQSPPRRPPVK